MKRAADIGCQHPGDITRRLVGRCPRHLAVDPEQCDRRQTDPDSHESGQRVQGAMHKPARRQTGAPWRCRSGCRGLHPDGIERDNAAARRAAQGCARAREDTGNSKRRRSVGMPGAPARRGGYGAAVAPMRKGKARTPRTLSVSRWALIAQAGAALPAWDSN
ncbi:hypothetical protein D3C72_1234690 [compost metagenome]